MKRVLLYIGIALVAIGCTKDPGVDTPSGDNALTFTSNIATRADKSAWADTDTIGVYMTSTSADATFGGLGANREYTYAGSDKFTSDDPLYLPTSGSVEIFAYYPYVNGVDLTAYPITSSEQVDILSATNSDVSSSNVALTFNHLLSKVSLTIEAGDGVSLQYLDALVVTISGIGTKTAGFNLTKPAAEVTFSEYTELTFDTSITTDSDGYVTAISSSAIVIPQEFDDATLYFTTTTDETYSATITTDEFVTGLEYSYTITLKESGEVTISSATINGWNDGEATSGTADLVDIEYKSSDKTYYIYSAAGLKAFADLVNGVENTTAVTSGGISFSTTPQTGINGLLMDNIDLQYICGETLNGGSGINWSPIGTDYNDPYSGTFNGNGKLISGLYISVKATYAGLFGISSGTISNLGVSGSVIGSSYAGGVVASNHGYITNCYNNCVVSGGNTGGIAGSNKGTIVNCYNTGEVDIDNDIDNDNEYKGSVVGYNNTGGNITNCYDAYGNGNVFGTINNGNTSNCYFLANETIESTGAMSATDMQATSFITLLNNNAYTYNNPTEDSKPTVTACAWEEVTNDYPTLDFGTEPSYTDTSN